MLTKQLKTNVIHNDSLLIYNRGGGIKSCNILKSGLWGQHIRGEGVPN